MYWMNALCTERARGSDRTPLRQLFRRRRGNRAGMMQLAEDDGESAIELRGRAQGGEREAAPKFT